MKLDNIFYILFDLTGPRGVSKVWMWTMSFSQLLFWLFKTLLDLTAVAVIFWNKTNKNITLSRSSRPQVFIKINVFKDFLKFKEKQLCGSLVFKLQVCSMRLRHRCFRVCFVNFLIWKSSCLILKSSFTDCSWEKVFFTSYLSTTVRKFHAMSFPLNVGHRVWDMKLVDAISFSTFL